MLLAAVGAVTGLAQAPWPVAGATPSQVDPMQWVVGDANLALHLAQGPGGLGIQRIANPAVGDVHFETMGLFELDILAYGFGTRRSLFPSDFARCEVHEAGDTTFLVFSQPVASNLTVTVRIHEVDQGFDWDLRIDNPGRTHVVERSDFPIFRPYPIGSNPLLDSMITPLFGGYAYITVPFQPRLRFPHPSNTGMQVFCYYEAATGRQLYWQTKDGLGYRKDFTITGRTVSTEVRLSQYGVLNNRPGNDYISPYSTTLTTLRGNWYDAARRYRSWAINQRWMSRGNVRDAMDYPDKARDLRLHLLQYPNHLLPFDNFDDLALEAIQVQQTLGLDAGQMLTLWSDWNGKEFNADLPDFETVRSTVPGAISLLQGAGIGVLPYIHIDLWSEGADITSRLGMDSWALVDREGKVPEFLIGPAVSRLDRPHIKVDSAFEEVRAAKNAIIEDLARVLPRSLTWGGVYLDTWSATAPEINFNRNLRWDQGGTPLWELGRSAEGVDFQSTLEAVAPGGVLSSETPNEMVLDRADLVHYHPFIFNGAQVPLWESVYHGYVISSNLEGSTPETPGLVTNILETIHYDYHLGKVLGLANFFAGARSYADDLTVGGTYEPVMRFLVSAMQMEGVVRDHRVFGERLRPLELSIERSFETLSYFIVGAPAVAASAWRSPEGSLGVVVGNISSVSETRALDIPVADHGVVGSYRVESVDALGARTVLLSGAAPVASLNLTLPAYGIVFLEIVPGL